MMEATFKQVHEPLRFSIFTQILYCYHITRMPKETQ